MKKSKYITLDSLIWFSLMSFFVACLSFYLSLNSKTDFHVFASNVNVQTAKLPSAKTDDNHNYAGIKFLFFGDIMLDRNVKKAVEDHGFDYLLAKLDKDFFFGYDFVTANLEGPSTDGGNHYPPQGGIDFAFDPSHVAELKNYGFNFFNLANNHYSDQGQKGIQETEKNLTDMQIYFSGCQDRVINDCTSNIVTANGYKIGFAGFSMVYGGFEMSKAKAAIIKLKENSDLVVVNIHWGTEYTHQFGNTQRNTAYDLIDNGADLIIGHHPHVVQGMEIYKNKPIFYSLGNFIFDQYFSADTQEGLAVSLNLTLKPQKKYEIILYPFIGDASQVSLMAREQKNKFFETFVKWSDVQSTTAKILNDGIIKL